MIEEIEQSLKEKDLIGILTNYHQAALFFYTIDYNKEFYFGVEEFDFELEGYQIRLIDDFADTKIINNFSSKINVKEGLLELIKPYKIDLTSFETIFNHLYILDNVIIIEREYDDEDSFYLIGKITKVTSVSVWFKGFNVDGMWNDEISIIPFDIITTIRFDTKYINTWSKYIGEMI